MTRQRLRYSSYKQSNTDSVMHRDAVDKKMSTTTRYLFIYLF